LGRRFVSKTGIVSDFQALEQLPCAAAFTLVFRGMKSASGKIKASRAKSLLVAQSVRPLTLCDAGSPGARRQARYFCLLSALASLRARGAIVPNDTPHNQIQSLIFKGTRSSNGTLSVMLHLRAVQIVVFRITKQTVARPFCLRDRR
jgi:hypothetical protein